MRTVVLLVLWLLPLSGLWAQDLDAEVYDKYLGTYRTADNKEYVIGRSFVRLFFFDPQTNDYRGLYRVNDTTWFSGPTILIDAPNLAAKIIEFRFRVTGEPRILISEAGRSARIATRTALYSEEAVRFQNGAVTLAGTLLLPKQRRRAPAVVLLHGSGEQNRHGYASYMRLIADHLAKNGIAVLTYDKRGCGQSTGKWQTASFQDLASDARSAQLLLSRDPRVDPRQIGFGGSSQAGWVLAKITAARPGTPFVFCVSGAGTGLSAATQNLYNTATELRATGATEQEVADGLQAWHRLYEYVQSYQSPGAARLDSAVARLASQPLVRDLLPPKSTEIAPEKKDQWFQALEIDYDPAPEWAAYRGNVLALFGELDASTPVREASDALARSLKRGRARSSAITVYPRASHLLLRASKRSDSEFGSLTAFEPHFLPDLSNWILAVTRAEIPALTQVKKLERAWLAAYETADSVAMKKILAAGFRITFPNGVTQTKQAVVKNLPGLLACCPGVRLFTSMQHATRRGRTVTLTGIVTTEFVKNGVKEVIRQRYTDEYTEADGTWKVMASRLTDYE